jgi:glycosyltransferase involved in cell wall biosynthesis
MRDLFVTTHTPILRSGRALRTYGVARALAASGDGLDLLYTRFEGDEPDATFRAIPGIELHEVLTSRGARRALGYMRARLSGTPISVARGISPDLAKQTARLAALPNRGRVVADGPLIAATLAGLARKRAVIYNAHNFESGFRHELGVPGTGSPRMLRAFERGLLARASESWMVSDADLAAAHELCPSARLRYVPNVVDVAAIEPVTPRVDQRRALFVANFEYKPNQTGLSFLLEEVLPLVWQQLPDATLALVGAGLAQPPSSDPRVQTLGFVDDLRTAYAESSCAVVPLLQGGGTPLKLVEALAYGLPAIVTPRAVAGLGLRDGEGCLVADGAQAFADTLTRVLREGAPEVARAGRRLSEERYSIEALSALLEA